LDFYCWLVFHVALETTGGNIVAVGNFDDWFVFNPTRQLPVNMQQIIDATPRMQENMQEVLHTTTSNECKYASHG